jgi:ketosteroid isomerase-like protein
MSVVLALLLAAPPAGAPDLRAENVALGSADAAMAAATAARDAKGFASRIAEDAIFVFEGAPLAVGRAGVVGLWSDLFKDGGPTLTWRPTSSYVAASRDLAYTEGEFLSKARGPDGKEASRSGRYVTVWRKQLDGEWRAVVDIGNRTAGPAAGTAPNQAVIRAETSADGELQYALTAYEADVRDAGGRSVKRTGRYLTIRRKQPDGSWRTVLTADTAPEAGAAR